MAMSWLQADMRLELARAYLELKDVDAARELLWEVVQMGTPEQRVRARFFLRDIALSNPLKLVIGMN